MNVTTAAFPFIPAELHYGHLASTYLPADIHHRAMKSLGQESLLISATDVHGAWVRKEKLANGMIDTSQLIDSWHEKYRKQLNSFGILFDIYFRTDEEWLKNLSYSSLFRLRDKNYISSLETEVYACEDCGENLPKRMRYKSETTSRSGKKRFDYDTTKSEIECGFCSSNRVFGQRVNHWFFDLNKGREITDRFIANQIDMNVRNYLQSQEEFVNWDITRDKYDGIKMPFGKEDQFLYLWYESLLGYFHPAIFENALKNHQDICFNHFIGKNIIYYHGTALPIMAIEGLEISNFVSQVSARGFLDFDGSSKMFRELSVPPGINSDYLRFYVAFKTPDSIADYSFSDLEFKNIVNKLLCNGLCSFFKRCRVLLDNAPLANTLMPSRFGEEYKTSKKEIVANLKALKIRSSLQKSLDYLRWSGTIFETEKLYGKKDQQSISDIAFLLATNLSFFSPFIPKITESYNPFKNWNPEEKFEFENFQNLEIVKSEIPFWQRI